MLARPAERGEFSDKSDANPVIAGPRVGCGPSGAQRRRQRRPDKVKRTIMPDDVLGDEEEGVDGAEDGNGGGAAAVPASQEDQDSKGAPWRAASAPSLTTRARASRAWARAASIVAGRWGWARPPIRFCRPRSSCVRGCWRPRRLVASASASAYRRHKDQKRKRKEAEAEAAGGRWAAWSSAERTTTTTAVTRRAVPTPLPSTDGNRGEGRNAFEASGELDDDDEEDDDERRRRPASRGSAEEEAAAACE